MKLYDIDSEREIIKPSIYKKDGKNVYVCFDKCFNVDNIDSLNTFLITKTAYSKNLDSICRYSNIFFKEYDQDNEYLSALLVIKYQIDNKTIQYPFTSFLSDMCEYLLSDKIIEKIFTMVDDYYSIDLSPTDEVKNLDLHALQFMNEHGKAMMALSIAYKLCIPVICHYYAINAEAMADRNKIKKLPPLTIKNYLYQIFTSFFPLFQGDSELFNKLVVTVNSHLTATKNSEKILWNRAKNKKITPTIYADRLVEAIVVDLMPKFIFNKNLIFLIQVAIPYQIKTILLAKDRYDYSDISMTIKSDELSGLEKMETNSARISDLDIIIASLNIKKTIKKIEKEYDIYPEKEELYYYQEKLTNFMFSDIVLQFFSKYFGGYYDLKTISRKKYIKLLVIFKHVMESMGFVFIHQIMTGNLSKSVKRRKISNKQLQKIEKSKRFMKLMEQYSHGIDPDNNPIVRNIAKLINTPIEYCDFNLQEREGELIEADIEIVADEYIRFLKMIS